MPASRRCSCQFHNSWQACDPPHPPTPPPNPPPPHPPPPACSQWLGGLCTQGLRPAAQEPRAAAGAGSGVGPCCHEGGGVEAPAAAARVVSRAGGGCRRGWGWGGGGGARCCALHPPSLLPDLNKRAWPVMLRRCSCRLGPVSDPLSAPLNPVTSCSAGCTAWAIETSPTRAWCATSAGTPSPMESGGAAAGGVPGLGTRTARYDDALGTGRHSCGRAVWGRVAGPLRPP